MYRFSDSRGETYAGRWLSLNRCVAAVVLLQLRDRQTDRQTPDRCFTLSAVDATSVISYSYIKFRNNVQNIAIGRPYDRLQVLTCQFRVSR